MAITHLPPMAIDGHQPVAPGGPDHPMRIATQRAAGLAPEGWTGELRDQVRTFFDQAASDWHASRTSPGRTAIVADALGRGLVPLQGGASRLAIELGSGTGAYSGIIAERFVRVLAVDLSMAMLREAAAGPAHRIQADGARLPVADAAADAVVLINAFLFPDEVARVLAPAGAVVWVNSSGERTPIHLPVDEVAARLPGTWSGVASRAGEGLWCVLRRA